MPLAKPDMGSFPPKIAVTEPLTAPVAPPATVEGISLGKAELISPAT